MKVSLFGRQFFARKAAFAHASRFLLASAVLLLTGCVHYAKDVRLVAISEEAQLGKSLGPVQGEDCATQVLGFGRSRGDLTANAAMGRIQSAQGARYINGFNLTSTSRDYVVWTRSCLVVTGEGFK